VDERDKDLTGLFVRDLDEIPLPARGAWRRASRRENTAMRASRMFLTAGAVVAVLAIALIIGLQLGDRKTTTANPSASPTPSGSSATIVVPSASATSTPCVGPCGPTGAPSSAPGVAIYNDDFGFVVSDIGTTPTIQPALTSTIRKESSGATIGEFTHNGFWASPDGTLIAYWTPGSASEPTQLRIVRAANPQSLVASSGLGVNESGGFIVWANDSSAVAYVVLGPATTITIRTFNTRPGSSGPGQVVFTFTEGGRGAAPVAWDRATNMLAISVFGSGGFITDYIVADSATPGANAKRTPVGGKITSMAGSSDAKYILAIDADTGFSYWPLASIGSKVTPAEAKYGQAGAMWRPGTHEIGFIGPSSQFWLCNVERNTPLGCGTTAFSGVPAGASLRMFRADGSAVLLAVSGGAQTSYTLVKFTGDPLAAKATGGDRVTFQASDGLRAAIRLR
jgi:hypothetical protein